MELLTHFIDDEFSSGLHLAMGSIQEEHPQNILTGEEQSTYRAFTNDNRRNEFISTRYLIRQLAGHAGLDPDEIKTKKDQRGKPFVQYQREHLYMSIAHADSKVLCALSRKLDVGVDIEPKGREVHEGLRERILHPSEVEELRHVKSIRLWTLKEAAVKLLGYGLRMNLNKLILSPDDDNCFLAIFNNEKNIRICSFQYQEYWISVAHFI